MDTESECEKGYSKSKNRTLTPELIVVAAALGLPAAVSGLTDVALVVHTFTVQEALQERSRVTLKGKYYQHLNFEKHKTPCRGIRLQCAVPKQAPPQCFMFYFLPHTV